MPELPEVETVVSFLKKNLVGSVMEEVVFFRTHIRAEIPQDIFRQVFLGQKIGNVVRRSKYIICETPVGFGLFHLGMTGRMVLSDKEQALYPHTHMIAKLDAHEEKVERQEAQPVVKKLNKKQTGDREKKRAKNLELKTTKKQFLHFSDPRRFGLITAGLGGNWREHPLLINLGVEPLLEPELGAYLFAKARKRSVSIKSFLMHQNIMVGVGNIYACESLFKAGITPKRRADKVSREEFTELANVVCRVLLHAIRSGGSSIRDYVDSSGQAGSYASNFEVYGRTGEPCKKCKSPIQVIPQDGRRSWFCKNCQK